MSQLNILSFASIGFIRGCNEMFEFMKPEVPTILKITPALAHGIVMSCVYLSIPYFSNKIVDMLKEVI